MATDSEATAAEVQALIETDLTTSEIESYLDDAHFDNQQANDTSSMTTAEKAQLEKHLAALKIVQSKDPAVSRESVADASFTYDGSTVQWLRGEVAKRDPSGTLASSVVRDSDRHVTSTVD